MEPTSSMDIERLLIWTYQDQAADTVVARSSGYSLVCNLDSTVMVARRCALGCRIQGEMGVVGYLPAKLHPDAEMVHDAVRALPATEIGLVITHAKSGTRPDWMPGARPMALPILRANGKPLVEYGPDKKTAWCPVRFDPAPEHIDFMRGVWLVWWDALATLVERLDGTLGRKVLMPTFPREPWMVRNGIDAAEKV